MYLRCLQRRKNQETVIELNAEADEGKKQVESDQMRTSAQSIEQGRTFQSLVNEKNVFSRDVGAGGMLYMPFQQYFQLVRN